MSIKQIALLLACIGETIFSMPATTTFIRNTMEFHHEDVIFRNTQADVTLAGTLTVPKSQGPFPAALLIAGYGPNDRDVTGAGQKHFKVLAEYLTRQGIVVLRYDKRGVGQSTGEYNTTATTRDYADDARAGIEYLQTRNEIDPTKIGLIGLSEGGLIASMLTAECKAVAFTVLLAPALRADVESFVEQSGLQLQADGASSEFIKRDKLLRREIYTLVTQEADLTVAETKLQKAVAEYLASLPEAQALEGANLPFAFTAAKAAMLVSIFNSPWYRFYWAYDAAIALERITTPVLCVNGDRDWIASAQKVFARLNATLTKAGNKDYTLVELANLNHCFQRCKTGALAEYFAIKESMDLLALQTIGDWIVRAVNK